METLTLNSYRKGFDAQSVIERNKEIVRAVGKNPMVNLEFAKPEISIDQIKEYLRSKHVTLWATFSIHNDPGLERAASWLKNEIDQLNTFECDS